MCLRQDRFSGDNSTGTWVSVTSLSLLGDLCFLTHLLYVLCPPSGLLPSAQQCSLQPLTPGAASPLSSAWAAPPSTASLA